ncbi:MAG: 16S rRNA (cytidine(1402)-2'-O)-methyltransferase [Gammaproteobacteria bacterium]|jgi:16S rRNA (cytidine1402-2'-O)-methyltransferase
MLYIVATPIGNLTDFSYRAIDTLQNSDLIVVEDTRRSKILLNHYNINIKTISLHEHNEQQIVVKLLKLLKEGKTISLISDAGTPLISDPGYHLVKQAHLANIVVSPIPGPSSVITAISVSGLATDQFIFIGFLPSKLQQKQKTLLDLVFERRTMIFFEAPSRLIDTIECMQKVFGADREATFCRELTKKFETIKQANLANIYDFIVADQLQQTKGEIVIVVAGNLKNVDEIDANTHKILQNLLTELPLTKAAALTAKITGISKKKLYDYGISLSKF